MANELNVSIQQQAQGFVACLYSGGELVARSPHFNETKLAAKYEGDTARRMLLRFVSSGPAMLKQAVSFMFPDWLPESQK